MKNDNFNSVNDFMTFGHNYPHDFIAKAFESDHLQSKFDTMYASYGTMTFFMFYMELSDSNKQILTDFVASAKETEIVLDFLGVVQNRKDQQQLERDQTESILTNIHLNVTTYFDEVNGNSYFSGEIFMIKGNDKIVIPMPFRYGYGTQYMHEAKAILTEFNYISAEYGQGLERYCRDNDIIIGVDVKEVLTEQEML